MYKNENRQIVLSFSVPKVSGDFVEIMVIREGIKIINSSMDATRRGLKKKKKKTELHGLKRKVEEAWRFFYVLNEVRSLANE